MELRVMLSAKSGHAEEDVHALAAAGKLRGVGGQDRERLHVALVIEDVEVQDAVGKDAHGDARAPLGFLEPTHITELGQEAGDGDVGAGVAGDESGAANRVGSGGGGGCEVGSSSSSCEVLRGGVW